MSPNSAHRPRNRPQNSSFLNLPAEIRTPIYQKSLLSPTPIDLCPNTHCDNAESLAELSLHSTKYATFMQANLPTQLRTRSLGRFDLFRLQLDLLYVRTELAPGLLGTCRQIYTEASPIFWTENTFRFSRDERWEMLWRFLLTIGSAARARIKKLEVFAPFAGDPIHCDRPSYFKNVPKKHMVKILKRRLDDKEGDCRGKAFEMLMRERWLEGITFVVPATYCVMGVGGRWGLPMGFLPKVTVVLEAGGWIEKRLDVGDFLDEGFDFVAAPDRYGDTYRGFDGGRTIVNPTGRWKRWEAGSEFLEGVSRLFEEEVVEVHSNGGRANVPEKGRTLARELKGFGPCVVVVVESAVEESVVSIYRGRWRDVVQRVVHTEYKSLVDVRDGVMQE